MAHPVHRFDATSLGSQGSGLLSAIAFLLRRRASPPAARPPLDRAVSELSSDVPSLRDAAALRVRQLATLFPGSGADLWAVASVQLGPAGSEGGSIPADLPSYLSALLRPGRCLDTLQIAALADALSVHLLFFTPASPSDLGAGWRLCWDVAPRDPSLVILARTPPPLCLGIALGRAWALECPVEPSDLWGPGLPDVPLALLREAGALPSLSSPSPSCLSLLVAAQDDAGSSSTVSDDFHFLSRVPGSDPLSSLDVPASWRSPSPPSPPSPPAGPDLDVAERVEHLLALEADEICRHLLLRSLFGDLLRDSSAAFFALGRVP